MWTKHCPIGSSWFKWSMMAQSSEDPIQGRPNSGSSCICISCFTVGTAVLFFILNSYCGDSCLTFYPEFYCGDICHIFHPYPVRTAVIFFIPNSGLPFLTFPVLLFIQNSGLPFLTFPTAVTQVVNSSWDVMSWEIAFPCVSFLFPCWKSWLVYQRDTCCFSSHLGKSSSHLCGCFLYINQANIFCLVGGGAYYYMYAASCFREHILHRHMCHHCFERFLQNLVPGLIFVSLKVYYLGFVY